MTKNRQWFLASRPSGMFEDDTFAYREVGVPSIGPGEFLVRNLYLSLDPAMRGWIRDTASYIEPVQIGDVMRGATVGVVVESQHPNFQAGDHVLGLHGWQDYCVVGDKGISRKLPQLPLPLTSFLSVLGVTGLTAYFGLLDIGKPAPGQTVLVSTAAGAVGSIVGQIAKLKGCRAVGIAGSDDKCDWITGELGYDAAINYKRQDVGQAIQEACPNGVDVYFDNVGGEQLDAALAHINRGARVVICGAISVYNVEDRPAGPRNYLALLSQRASMTGFVLLDYVDRFMEGAMELAQWVMQGKVKYREHIVNGLENAPSALRMLFDGTNRGKLMVKIADG
jgi:hypothetical protein